MPRARLAGSTGGVLLMNRTKSRLPGAAVNGAVSWLRRLGWRADRAVGAKALAAGRYPKRCIRARMAEVQSGALCPTVLPKYNV